MSIAKVYYGPYLRVASKEVYVEHFDYQCAEGHKTWDARAKFCALCGRGILPTKTGTGHKEGTSPEAPKWFVRVAAWFSKDSEKFRYYVPKSRPNELMEIDEAMAVSIERGETDRLIDWFEEWSREEVEALQASGWSVWAEVGILVVEEND